MKGKLFAFFLNRFQLRLLAITDNPRLANGVNDLSESERKSVIFDIFIAIAWLSPYIFIRLLIKSPKLLLNWLEPRKKIVQGIDGSYLLSLAEFLYSKRTVDSVFTPIVGDWREELYQALMHGNMWKARWIRLRYTYAFLVAMWLKSPMGNLIEFVIKIAKS